MLKIEFLLIVSFTIFSCAGTKSNHSAVDKGENFISPGGSIDVEYLITKNKETGVNPPSYMGKITLKPGAVVAKHKHKSSGEYLYFIKGNGELTIGQEVIKLKDNMAVYIPKGAEHSYVNTGKKKSIAIQFFDVNGPEQRFKKWKDDL